MGNDSTQQYTIHELLGQTTIQHELLLKQIASSVVYELLLYITIEYPRMQFHFCVTL